MSRLLVDDVTKTDARALLNVNKMATISDIVAPSNEYIYASGANELTVVEGCVIAVGGAGIFKTANTILTAANLDAGSAFAVGKDYYVYICDSRIDSADEKYVISLNSTYPTGWNATNSRKIGGFHYGRCRKVDSNLQPLNGSSVIFGTGWESAVSNGIVPRSVWTLGHRPKCSPEGMVYLGGGTWVDIYLNSDDGAKGLKSEYGCAPMTGTESMNWYNFVERLAKSGKRLPNYAEFCAYAFGSPAGLDNANTNAWSATSNTGRGVTGSVVNAVSSVGVVDAVGRVWEWLDELITRAEHATNADYHASVAWGWDKKSPLNTGEKSYDVGNICQYYAYSLAALLAGGNWNIGANCGARAVDCSSYPWYVLRIEQFLREELKLEFNPKTTMLAAKNGIDFVGYKHRATHRKVRKDSIKRIKRTIKKCESGKITKEQLQKSIQSWTGHAGHADSYNLRKKIETLAEAAIEKAA